MELKLCEILSSATTKWPNDKVEDLDGEIVTPHVCGRRMNEISYCLETKVLDLYRNAKKLHL